MSNAIIVLYNSNGEEIKKVRTEKNGSFTFINLEPGLYNMKVEGDGIRFESKEFGQCIIRF